MTNNLIIQTLKQLDPETNIQVLAWNYRTVINHHCFRGISLSPKELIKMFDGLCQRYRRITRRASSLAWLQEEKKIYQCFLLSYCFLHFKKVMEISSDEWSTFSTIFDNKNLLLLKYEAKIIEKSHQRVKWTDFQENLLSQCTQGTRQLKWADISRHIFFKSEGCYFKTPKQCRQHWNNHLNQEITHGGWNIDQDLAILNFVFEQGRKWSKIALQLQNKRTEHMIKNRFHSLLTCSRHLLKKKQEFHKTENQLIGYLIKILASKQKKLQNMPNLKRQNKNEDRVKQSLNSIEHQQLTENKASQNQPPNLKNIKDQNLPSYSKSLGKKSNQAPPAQIIKSQQEQLPPFLIRPEVETRRNPAQEQDTKNHSFLNFNALNFPLPFMQFPHYYSFPLNMMEFNRPFGFY